MTQNKYTKQYEEFKTIPFELRLQYNQRICKIPLLDTDFDYKQYEPNFYHQLLVSTQPKVFITLYVWEPKQQPKGILFLHHGLNGYIGTLSNFAEQIRNSNGFVVIGHDSRGFGRSKGLDFGLITRFQDLITDAQKVIQWGTGKYKIKNIFLGGLSMGGSLCLNLGIRKKFQYTGVIFMSPGLQSNPANPMPLSFIHYVQLALFPRSYLYPPSYKSGCRYKKFMDRVQTNQLIYNGNIRAGTISQLGRSIPKTRALIGQFDLPYLFIQSGVDKSVNPFQIIDFEKKCKSTDKTHYFDKDMWHAVCFDQQRVPLSKQISKWIELKSK